MSETAARFDTIALGEIVIDLVPIAHHEGSAYAAKPGGAPANLAAGIARLGLKSAVLGKVGNEAFGDAALAALRNAGVATDAVIRTDRHNTPVAVIAMPARGEARYFFYRDNSADTNLTAAEVALDAISRSRILHVGTLLLATPISAAAQRHAIQHAQQGMISISVDVNFRSAFWHDRQAMLRAGAEMISCANLVKLNREELALLSDHDDVPTAVRALWHPKLELMAVTDGASGASLFTRDEATVSPAFDVDVVDTVGCGDAYWANMLAAHLGESDRLTGEKLVAAGRRACAAGAIVATRRGALDAMPTAAEVNAFLDSRA